MFTQKELGQRDVFIFYCCVTNHYKFSSWKQHPSISSQACRAASRWGRMSSLLRVSQGQGHGVSWVGFHLESQEKSPLPSSFSSGRIQVLKVVGPRFEFPWQLWSLGPLTVRRGQLHPFSCGPTCPSSQQQQREESFSCFDSFPLLSSSTSLSCHQPEKVYFRALVIRTGLPHYFPL